MVGSHKRIAESPQSDILAAIPQTQQAYLTVCSPGPWLLETSSLSSAERLPASRDGIPLKKNSYLFFSHRLSLSRCHAVNERLSTSLNHLPMSFKVAGMYIYSSLTTVIIDRSLLDISLAAFGRKEIEIAEVRLVIMNYDHCV